jgi:hypothetical protein
MKIYSRDNKLNEVCVEHNGAELRFDSVAYSRATQGKVAASEVFDTINQYFAYLPIDRQRAIFNCYANIEGTLQRIFDINLLIEKLNPMVTELYNLMPENEIGSWCFHKAGFIIHEDIKDVPYDCTPEERTYLTTDYRNLQIFCTVLRPMLPIWGHFMHLTAVTTGSNNKEHVAARLITGAWINWCPAKERLEKYIQSSIALNSTSATAVIGWLGTGELPNYFLSQALVRRLIVSDLKQNIVSGLYKYLFLNVLPSLDTGRKGGGAGPIRPKNDPDKDTRDGDNTSLAESYKVRQETPDATLEFINAYARRPYAVAAKIDPDYNRDYLDRCLERVQILRSTELLPHMEAFSMNVCAKPLPTNANKNLVADSCLNTIAVTQALLWHWGFIHLAALMTGFPIKPDDDFESFIDVKEKIDENLKDQLVAIFPHFYQRVGNSAASLDKQRRSENPGIKNVEALMAKIRNAEWLLTCPDELMLATGANPSTRKLILPKGIKDEIARLLIHIDRM